MGSRNVFHGFHVLTFSDVFTVPMHGFVPTTISHHSADEEEESATTKAQQEETLQYDF